MKGFVLIKERDSEVSTQKIISCMLDGNVQAAGCNGGNMAGFDSGAKKYGILDATSWKPDIDNPKSYLRFCASQDTVNSSYYCIYYCPNALLAWMCCVCAWSHEREREREPHHLQVPAPTP